MSSPNTAIAATAHTDIGGNSTVNLQKMHQREQLRLGRLWDEHLQNRTEYVCHRETVVMIIYWKDSDLNKEALFEEVDDLTHVFQHDYGFTVINEVLDSSNKPQHKINRVLGEFIEKYDKPETLLIIYYAGHGWSLPKPKNQAGNKGFLLTDKATAVVKASIAWHSAEELLSVAEDADLLAIFDCCDAGSLCNARAHHRFEYLGACQENKTTSPAGPRSFTRALIWALTQLKEGERSWFSTPELLEKIMAAPKFPPEQCPRLGPRAFRAPDYIVLAPANQVLRPAQARKQRDAAVKPKIQAREYLDLRFRFDQTLNEEDLKTTASELQSLIRERKIKASEVTFMEKHDRHRGWDLVRRVLPDLPWLSQNEGFGYSSPLSQAAQMLRTPSTEALTLTGAPTPEPPDTVQESEKPRLHAVPASKEEKQHTPSTAKSSTTQIPDSKRSEPSEGGPRRKSRRMK